MLGPALCAALACLLAACEGGPLSVGEREQRTQIEGGGSSAPVQQRCADPAALRVLDADCWPTRHVGRWHGFVTGDARYGSSGSQPISYPSGDVLLEIAAEGSASARFSPGDADDAGVDATEWNDAAVTGAAAPPALLLGFSYTLEGLRMSGGPSEDRRQDPRVEFSLLIAEPWAASCADLARDAGPCVCDARGCSISAYSLRGSLVLSQDGRALRGSASSVNAAEDLTAGWEFVRE